MNHLQQELNYKSLLVEVLKLKLPRTLYTEYSIADLKLLLHSLKMRMSELTTLASSLGS